jgi:acetylornithine deacetylase
MTEVNLRKPTVKEAPEMDIHEAMERTTPLLAELVRCPSVNPNNTGALQPPFGETRLQEFVAARLAARGAALQWIDALPGRRNFVATFAGRDPRRSLMLEAHADTVGIEGMSIDPFGAVIEAGRLHGRGACDAKGSMAAMLTAVEELLRREGRPPVTVHVVLTCNEERGGHGAHALMKAGFRADAAIVGEPTALEIVNIHKGALRWDVETHGVAAHSSTPELGVNAISMMARAIAEIESSVIPALRERRHERLGAPTMVVGTIQGGTQVNVIPARCKIEVDRRMVPGETNDAAAAEVTAALERLARADEKFRWTLAQTEWYPPLQEPEDSPVAAALAAACRTVVGRATFACAPWATDGGIFRHYGVPTVVFGPGAIRKAHTKDEFVELDQVAAAALVYAEAIREFGAAG